MRRAAIIALVIVFAAACGDGEDETSDEPNLNSLGAELTETHCGKIFSCCDEDERFAAFQGIPVADQEQCTSSVEGIVQVNVIPRYEEALANGTITYSGDVESCMNGYARLACDEFQPDPRLALVEIPACRALFEAQLETTEFCSDDFECKSGFCAITGEMGTCAEIPGEGEACVAGRCDDGLYCMDGTCTPRRRDGEPCDVSAECESGNCIDPSMGGEGQGDLECAPLPPACGG